MSKKIIGLNDMFGIPESSFEVVELGIDELVQRKDHKWKPMSEDKLAWFDASIRDVGVVQPIIVRPAEDIPYSINGSYEILAGNTRYARSKAVGKKTIPAIVKSGLSEEEAAVYVNYTNIQRDWTDMSYSQRAKVIADAYNIQSGRELKEGASGTGFTPIFEEINSYLKTYANPVNSMAEGVLSPGETNTVREVAKEHDLSRPTVARYIRIDVLEDGIKELLDNGKVTFKAAVQLSYISEENQDLFVELMTGDQPYKCNEEQAKAIRELQIKNKLTIVTMTEVLAGIKKKKPGKPKGYKVSGTVISKYFTNNETDKEIGKIIEDALDMYFGRG